MSRPSSSSDSETATTGSSESSGSGSTVEGVGGARYVMAGGADLLLHFTTTTSGVGRAIFRLPHAITDMSSIASVVVTDPLDSDRLVACSDLYGPDELRLAEATGAGQIGAVAVALILTLSCVACMSFYWVAWFCSERAKAAANERLMTLGGTVDRDVEQRLVDSSIEEAMMTGGG